MPTASEKARTRLEQYIHSVKKKSRKKLNKLNQIELNLWAYFVKLRDECCKKCGSTAQLHAHHIKPKAIYPEIAFDVNNGVLLCSSCHAIEHANDHVYHLMVKSESKEATTVKPTIREITVKTASKKVTKEIITARIRINLMTESFEERARRRFSCG